MDFAKTAAKNQLKKALEKAVSEGKLMKEAASYFVPASEMPMEELEEARQQQEEAWRQQKIILPLEECNFTGYTAHCEQGKR